MSGYGGARGGGRGRGNYYQDDSGYDSGYQQRGDGYQQRGDGYQPRGGGGGGGRYQGNRGGYQGGRQYNRGRTNDGSYRGRNQTWRRGDSNGQRRQYNEKSLPEDIVQGPVLEGHQQKVACLVYGADQQQLYSGSKDGTVKVWSTATGQLISTVPVGGQVNSLLYAQGFLVVGLKQPDDQGVIRLYNTATGAEQILMGHKGEVLCLVTANQCLFSGGQDHTIRVWAANPATGSMECTGVLDVARGGHTSPVDSMIVWRNYLISGDRLGCIKAWDIEVGVLAQTLEGAHQDAVLNMLIYENYLISGSLDGYIVQWSFYPQPGMHRVINAEPYFTYEPAADRDGDQYQRRQRAGGARVPNGVLMMYGTVDGANNSVLLVSYNQSSCIKLLQLPEFEDRGIIPEISLCRAIAVLPQTPPTPPVLVLGDAEGKLRIYNWVVPRTFP